jgi:hypothetical protein
MLSFNQWLTEINESSEVALKNKSKASKIPLGILRTVYNKGMAAWRTGHRPGVTQQQWAMARVNSFIMGGKTTKKADKSLWERAKKIKKEEINVT